ncbi:MAG: DUF4395 domain-containing protein [Demequina sp.]|uniref:DUF4395 domain-containing protein n=1 Tax=Demequina sp. TaxID=2050685 RepID=UPI003A86A66A
MTSTDIQIDPRGYRFGAAITLAFAVAAVLLGSDAGLVPMAILVVLFIPAAFIGPQASVQSWLFKRLIRPRIGAPTETESFRAPRFAQQMGLAMAALALVFGLLDVAAGFYVFGVLVLIASFLNAVFGFCLGCEIYLGFKKLTSRAA